MRILNLALLVAAIGLLTSCQKQPKTVLELAELHFRNGEWNEAISASTKHLSGDPGNGGALSLRGRAKLASGDFPGAIDDFTKQIELAPEDCDAYYRRSMAYEELGDLDLAKADLDRGRELDPYRKSAYAYEPGNFMSKPSISGGTESLSEESESSEDSAVAMSEKDAELQRELDQDFYDREVAAEEMAAQESDVADESVDSDQFTSSVRSGIRSGELDEDFVRQSVEGVRSMLDEPKKPRKITGVMPRVGSRSSMSIDDLLAPLPDENDSAESEVEGDGLDSMPLPPVSTSLPPGVLPMGTPGGQASGGSLYPTYPNSSGYGNFGNGIPNSSPYVSGGRPPIPGVVPGAGGSLPSANRTGGLSQASPYQLQGIPIHQQGSKPPLSTSLPSGLPPRVVPANPVAPGNVQSRPPMLPRPAARNQ